MVDPNRDKLLFVKLLLINVCQGALFLRDAQHVCVEEVWVERVDIVLECFALILLSDAHTSTTTVQVVKLVGFNLVKPALRNGGEFDKQRLGCVENRACAVHVDEVVCDSFDVVNGLDVCMVVGLNVSFFAIVGDEQFITANCGLCAPFSLEM